MPPEKTASSKIDKILLCTLLALGTITGRLYYLQILHGRTFVTLGKKNYHRTETVLSLRGSITDHSGKLLATNRPVINLSWYGTNQYRLSDLQQKTLTTLSHILGTNFLEQKIRAPIARAERRGKVVRLANDISFQELSKIVEQLPDNPNLRLSTTFERLYPNGALASHIIGCLGNIRYEKTGTMGLEKLFENDLKGEHGLVEKTINAVGKKIEQQEIKQASSGITIETTLDLDVQKIAELAFPANYAGTFIIMDPKTGAIRALVSRPSFDPNMFLKPIDFASWQNLQEKKALLNRAFGACYPPASIFKLVTTTAALEEEIIDPDDIVYCKGFYEFGGYRHWCIRHTGHGELSVQEALAESCNILFYHIGKHIDIDTLAHYARQFGLGKKTNILFSEQKGLVPDRQWKYQNKHEQWWQGETVSVAIGQGFLLVTPIQIMRMIAGIFEGYLVKPRLLKNESIEKNTLSIAPKTLRFLQQGMRSAVTEGTGKRLSKLKDIEVYAKTGTAQISSLKLRSLDTNYLEHAWFVGYFTIKDQAPLTLVNLIENAGSSRVATTTAKNFLLEYRTFLDIQQKNRF